MKGGQGQNGDRQEGKRRGRSVSWSEGGGENKPIFERNSSEFERLEEICSVRGSLASTLWL